METKICSKCGKELPVSEFYKRKDGYYANCKACHRDITNRRYYNNKTAKPKSKPAEDKKHKIYTHKDLAVFEPRDLMLELKARGYEGELVYRDIKVIEHRINLLKLE